MAAGMDGQRDQFLAGSGFASHQDRSHAARNPDDTPLDGAQRLRCAHQALQCRSARVAL